MHELHINLYLQKDRLDMTQKLPRVPIQPNFEIWGRSYTLRQFLSPISKMVVSLSKVQSIMKGLSYVLIHTKCVNFNGVILTDFWNLLISLRATVPGLNLWGFLTPPLPATWAVFLAAFVANYFLGAFAPVFFLAVYFVLAMSSLVRKEILIISLE